MTHLTMSDAVMQDGRIAEAVAWQVSPAERHLVLDYIMEYALGRHLGAECVHIQGSADLLDAALEAPHCSSEDQAAALR